MDLSTVANVATAIAVLTGVAFGMIEIARNRREREERAAFEVVHAMLSPEWMESVGVVSLLPDGIGLPGLEREPHKLRAARLVGVIIETLGYSVYRRLVPLAIVDDLLGGVVRLTWRKLRAFIEEERAGAGSQKSYEWVQWLAERLDEQRPGKTSLTVGAHVAYRDWRP